MNFAAGSPGARPLHWKYAPLMAVFVHPFRVVQNTASGKFICELAQCRDLPLAEAAYTKAIALYPDDVITLQHGSKLLKRSDVPQRDGNR